MTSKELYQRIRAETYDRDIGQNGWLLAAELEQFVDRLIVGGCRCASARAANRASSINPPVPSTRVLSRQDP